MTVKDILFGANKGTLALTGDPYWDNVTVLTDTYGMNAIYTPARAITVYSNTTATKTASNGVSINTTNSKFGNSIYDSYAVGTIPLAIGTTDNTNPYTPLNTFPCTLEFWAYRVSHPNNNTSGTTLLGYTSSNETLMGLNQNGKILARINVDNTLGILAIGAWTHVAFVRQTSTVSKLYMNGVLAGTQTQAWTNIVEGYPLRILGMYDSARAGTAGTLGDPCLIENIRFTSGIARYTAAFTPPTTEFPKFKRGNPEPLTRSIAGTGTGVISNPTSITSTPATWVGNPTLTYQWESTPIVSTSVWSYTPVSGQTTTTFTTTPSPNCCYRLKTTATIGGLTTILYSNPVWIRVTGL